MLECWNMNTSNTSTRRPGRPVKPVTWPSGAFTINTLKDKQGVQLSRVSLQLKIKKAVDENELEVVGTEKGETKMGRPSVVYQVVNIKPSTLVQAVADIANNNVDIVDDTDDTDGF